jgi:tRNA(Ile)-lysidine synthase
MARRALTPTCLRLVQALEQHLPGGQPYRIGLSGGADSLALTAAMAWARDHRRGPLAGTAMTARIIDHQLQPGSAVVAQRAAAQARQLGITAEIVPVTVTPGPAGVEAAARSARYAALAEGPTALVVLAHTLDDQAETVLLGLARGSGVRSLSGMAPRRDNLVRPLLALRRTDTIQACHDWGLTWWEDPTNTDGSNARSRLRQAMTTVEQALGPGLAEGLARTADLCRLDADFLDAQAANTGLDPTQPCLGLDQLTGLPAALRHRLLLTWLRQIGHDQVTRAHVLAADALLTDWHGQRAVSVPGGQVVRTPGHLTRQPPPP